MSNVWLKLLGVFQAFALASSAPKLPSVKFGDLEQLLRRSDAEALVERLKDAGGKIGAFEVTNLPEAYRKSLESLMSDAPGCLKQGGLPRIRMPDGSLRTTFGTESGAYPACLKMAGLAAAFDEVEAMVVNMIEKVRGGSLVYGLADGTRVNLTGSPAKDHVHVYDAAPAPVGSGTTMVPFHTDNGMFLVISPFPDHGLDVELSNGSRMPTSGTDTESVLVLMGRGLTEWLFQPGGYPDAQRMRGMFHPVPHSVRSMLDVSTRTVYARMKVAQELAVPVAGDQLDNLKTFGDVFMEVEVGDYRLCSDRLVSQNHPDTGASQGHSMSHSMDMEASTSYKKAMMSLCKEGSAFCWMGCMELPESCPSSREARCYNEIKNLTCRTDPSGTVMDPGCDWHCKKKHVHRQVNKFCNYGTSMFMEGFEAAGSEWTNCVILFFKSWTLDSPLKFGMACVGVTCMGVLIELLIFVRRRLVARNPRSLTKKALVLFLFAVNIFVAYLVMLVAMTLSIELFACLILGLVIGHGTFNMRSQVAESIDPCCSTSHEQSKP